MASNERLRARLELRRSNAAVPQRNRKREQKRPGKGNRHTWKREVSWSLRPTHARGVLGHRDWRHMRVLQNVRVEVEYKVDRKGNFVTITRQLFTAPVSGNGVQWRKGKYEDTDTYVVEVDEVPELIKALATGLTFDDND